MFNSRVITVLGLVLAITAPAVFGAPPAWDSDSPDPDGVPNNVEYWMQRWGALVGVPAVDNASPTPLPILAWTANTYVDTDGDGIPDIVEVLFTHTDPNVRDDVACGGGGSPRDMTGQYEVRRAANLGVAVNFLTDEFTAISVCHTSGGIKVFEPRMGYATTASISGAGPYTLSANWNYLGTAVAFTGNCPSPCTGTNIVVTGTLSIGGALAAASATRRATAAPSAASVNGLYAGQVAHFPHQAGASPDKLGDLGSGAVQIENLSNSQAKVYTKETYEAFPAYYSLRTGTVFYTSFLYHADLYKDPYDPANSNDDSTRIALMVTEAPVSGVGGRIRGSDTHLYTSPGQAIAVTENQIYGKASAPSASGVTLTRTVGTSTLLYLNNVPVSADLATVSGPGITTSEIWNELDTNYYNERSFGVSKGVRLPGFIDGAKVGVATDGASLDVYSISHLFQASLASNTYAFNFTGAVGGFGTVNVPHTDHSSTPLPLVTGVTLTGSDVGTMVLTAGRQKSVPEATLDMTVDHVLSWSPVSTDGINGTGAGLYRVIITDPFGGRVSAPTSITDTSPDVVSFFVDPADLSNPCPSDCSVTIKGDTLAANTAYRIEIEARDKGDPNNRSLTDRFYLHTPALRPGDFNADRTSDLIWRHTTGLSVQWFMAGTTPASTAVLGGDTDWSIIHSTGDFDDDGRSDVIWRDGTTGLSVLWFMGGNIPTSTAVLGGDTDWRIVQIGDFNGDGKSDLIWARTSDGAVSQWLMDGATPVKTAVLNDQSVWSVVKIGDFNGDGKSDIIWRHGPTGLSVLWSDMTGATPNSTAVLGGDLNWSIIKIGDFDDDGKSDIIWRHGPTGLLVLWSDMTGATPNSTAVLGGDLNWTLVQ